MTWPPIRPRIRGILGGLALAGCLASPAGAGDSPLGLWLTDAGRGLIEIYPCGADDLCGRIARVDAEGAPPVDDRNPNPALRNRPLCGLQIFGGFVHDGAMWTDGWVYDPERGREFSFELEPLADGRLRIRGWAGMKVFGETQFWTRAPAGTVPCYPANSGHSDARPDGTIEKLLVSP